jgi:signal transduction histidine kinase
VAHRARRLAIAIELEKDGELPLVHGLQNEIGQTVLNLLANALVSLEQDASLDPRGPRILVRLQPRSGGVALLVRDNGMGVQPGELERVADLFYTTKDVGKGTGLGLALVHSTLARHGGTVRLSSEPGRFFQVELWFPGGTGPAA